MITDTQLSILTRALFDKVGNLEAVSEITGLTKGQLSKCQTLPGPERETSVLSLRSIIRLEEMLAEPVMTGAIAALIRAKAQRAPKPLLVEACELTEAAVALQKAVREAGARLSRNETVGLHAILNLVQRELDEVRAKLPPIDPAQEG